MGVASGQAFRSYACRPYAHWPVSATILNAKCGFNYKFVGNTPPLGGRGGELLHICQLHILISRFLQLFF